MDGEHHVQYRLSALCLRVMYYTRLTQTSDVKTNRISTGLDAAYTCTCTVPDDVRSNRRNWVK